MIGDEVEHGQEKTKGAVAPAYGSKNRLEGGPSEAGQNGCVSDPPNTQEA